MNYSIRLFFRMIWHFLAALWAAPFQPKPSELRLFIKDFDDGAGRTLSAVTQRKMLADSIFRTTYEIGRNRCVSVKAPNGYEAREYRAGADHGELDRSPVWADAVRYEPPAPAAETAPAATRRKGPKA